TAAVLGALLLLADTVPAFSAARRQMWGLHTLAYQEFREKLPARAAREVGRFVRGSADGLSMPAPVAEPQPGRHPAALRVTLSAPGAAQRHIHYTLDGSLPTRQSPRYREPIPVDSTVSLRWRVLAPRALPGDVATGVYLIEPDTLRLPLVALTMDSLDLWGKYSGIYVRPLERGREFERHAYVSVVEADGHEVGFEADVRIHGGYSRLAPKKSFRMRFLSSSVSPRVTATDILRPLPGPDEHTVVLRASAATPVTRLADALSTELYGSLGKPVSQAQPVRLSINGRYWGIYDLREYISPQFLASRFGDSPVELLAHDSENVGDWLTPVEGSDRRWRELVEFLRERDLAEPAAYDSASRWLDPNDLIDYWAHNIYAGNLDWPYNNAAVWRELAGDGPFRWLFWDGDATFNALGDFTRHNTLAWALRDRPIDSLKWNFARGGSPDAEFQVVATEPIRAFLRNPGFRDAFIARTLVLLSTTYRTGAVLPRLERLVDEVSHELPFEQQRWGGADSTNRAALGRMRDFIISRPAVIREHLADHFRLGGERPFVLDVRGPGSLRIGGQLWRDTTDTLTMLAGARLEVEALPDDGARLREAIARHVTVSARREEGRLRVRFTSAATKP
ncbi:MAG TPA: CotH kinase family protein, partial [Gemmatimonadaceae bacterium]|nr:CotH kinase family protein [Gemmatimonadaceae bacterium]